MAKIKAINLNTKKITEQEVSDDIFGVSLNNDILSQYVHIYRSNHRQGTSSSKTRAEISGGGKKPWRQKGTGRARAGSSRSPIWVHGGVAHGPKPKSWSLSFPKKMNQLVMKIVLSQKAAKNHLFTFENLKIEKPSTKDLLKIFTENKLYGKNLLVLSEVDANIIKSSSNIYDLKVAQAKNLNAYEVLASTNLIFTDKALEKFLERFNK